MKGRGNDNGARVFAVTASNLIFLRLGIDCNRPARICIGAVVKHSQVFAHPTNLLILALDNWRRFTKSRQRILTLIQVLDGPDR